MCFRMNLRKSYTRYYLVIRGKSHLIVEMAVPIGQQWEFVFVHRAGLVRHVKYRVSFGFSNSTVILISVISTTDKRDGNLLVHSSLHSTQSPSSPTDKGYLGFCHSFNCHQLLLSSMRVQYQSN